jgi:hypothetical protein
LTFRRPKNCAKPLTGPADVWAFAVRKLKKHPILFTHPRPRLSLFTFPLAEVLLLLTCATIASCDDFDEIASWGEHHLDFLRRFAPFHHGIPCERCFAPW